MPDAPHLFTADVAAGFCMTLGAFAVALLVARTSGFPRARWIDDALRGAGILLLGALLVVLVARAPDAEGARHDGCQRLPDAPPQPSIALTHAEIESGCGEPIPGTQTNHDEDHVCWIGPVPFVEQIRYGGAAWTAQGFAFGCPSGLGNPADPRFEVATDGRGTYQYVCRFASPAHDTPPTSRLTVRRVPRPPPAAPVRRPLWLALGGALLALVALMAPYRAAVERHLARLVDGDLEADVRIRLADGRALDAASAQLPPGPVLVDAADVHPAGAHYRASTTPVVRCERGPREARRLDLEREATVRRALLAAAIAALAVAPLVLHVLRA